MSTGAGRISNFLEEAKACMFPCARPSRVSRDCRSLTTDQAALPDQVEEQIQTLAHASA